MVDKTRRDVLKLAPIAAVSVAGCSDDGSSDSSPTDTTETRQSPSGETSTGPRTTRKSQSTESETQTQTETETETPQDQSASVEVGEVVSGDQMAMVVKSLSKTDSLGELQDAKEGNTYAVARLEVKNTTQNTYADFNSFLQVELQDGSGYSYSPTISASESAFEGGQLAPGEVARGDVAFEIPSDASDLSLYFDFSAFSFFDFERVSVDLSSKAGSIGDLQQSLHVSIHDVGNSVTHDGITVTVNSVSFETSLGEFTQAPDGKEFAIVDVTTKNGTDGVVAFSSLLQMSTKDGTGQSFSFSAMASSQLTQAYQGGEVEAGERTRGKVAFEVPEGVSPLYFAFEYSVISGGSKTFWQLR